MSYEFEFRTGRIVVDHEKCVNCTTYACVKACSLYNVRGILRVEKGLPVLAITREEAKRGLCTECFACEYECNFRGLQALRIIAPVPKPT